MTRVRAAFLGIAAVVAACWAFAPMASAAGEGPEVVHNPLPNTCFFLVNTPGYAGHVPGVLRFPESGPPELLLICAGPDF
jgi:hypothetical protein